MLHVFTDPNMNAAHMYEVGNPNNPNNPDDNPNNPDNPDNPDYPNNHINVYFNFYVLIF